MGAAKGYNLTLINVRIPIPNGMLDNTLRRFKDSLFRYLAAQVPSSFCPNYITLFAFVMGLASCLAASLPHRWAALSFWTLNRTLDCLDGAFARRWGKSTELGGFLDLLGDFTVYSLIPVSVVLGRGRVDEHGCEWMAVAVLEASFHLNNFILFYVAAVAAKVGEVEVGRKQESLTSVVMRPALVEGFEAGAFFTLMIIFPDWVTAISWIMSAAVGLGIIQRVMWVVPVLGQLDLVQKEEAK